MTKTAKVSVCILGVLIAATALPAKGSCWTEQGSFYANTRWNPAMKEWSIYDRPGNFLGSMRWNDAMKEWTFQDAVSNRRGSARFNPAMKWWEVSPGGTVRWEPNMSSFTFPGGKAVWYSGGWRIRDASNREVGVVDLYASSGAPELIYHVPYIYLMVPKPAPAPSARTSATPSRPSRSEVTVGVTRVEWKASDSTWYFTALPNGKTGRAARNGRTRTYRAFESDGTFLGRAVWSSPEQRWNIYDRKDVLKARALWNPDDKTYKLCTLDGGVIRKFQWDADASTWQGYETYGTQTESIAVSGEPRLPKLRLHVPFLMALFFWLS